jgi:hypothetical protein
MNMQKKYKNLYANGDSFVFGMESIEDFSKTIENKNFAFPKYLHDMLGCSTYVNNAYNGASNDFIFRRTVFDLTTKKLPPEETFVVIGWTSLHRIDVDGKGFFSQIPNFIPDLASPEGPAACAEFKDHQIMFVNPGIILNFIKDNIKIDANKEIIEWCAKYIWTDNLQVPLIESKIIALDHMLTQLGYDHIFVNTVINLPYTDHLDPSCKNFYKIESDSFYQWALKTYPAEHRAWNHFSFLAHKSYAEILFNYIQSRDE